MREDYLQTVKDAFTNFSVFSLLEANTDDALITVHFSYENSRLALFVLDPDNEFLRRILVTIEDDVDEEFKLPPHYLRFDDKHKRSSLCLINEEQHVLSSYTLFELICLYLNQLQSLLSLSPRQMEFEYLKEFEYYWNSACHLLGKFYAEAEIYLPTAGNASLLNCLQTDKGRYRKYVLFPEGMKFNSNHTPEGAISTALYIPIEHPVGIIPPQSSIPWGANDLLDIIYSQAKDRISADSFAFLKELQVDNYQKLVVFSFTLPDSVSISVTGILSFTSKERKSFITKIQEDFKSFMPISSSRMDLQYLHERVGLEHSVFPSVLLIGCGSVGSYILPELVNLGFVNIGVSDPDVFTSGNAFRHYLGPSSNGLKKASRMKLFLEIQNPLVSIDEVPNLLEMDDANLNSTILKYQLVIVAVGGTDLQRRFNYRFSKVSTTSWFLYNWLDAEGKGSHVLAMRYLHKGCYNCLFYDNGEPVARNKVSYADGSERVIGNGCGGSFSPYGNNMLVRNTSLVLSVIQGILNGTIPRNTVASIKNDFSSLESSITLAPVIDNNFAEERCDICGHI